MSIRQTILLFLSAFFVLSACDSNRALTDSERFRAQAINDAQVPIRKAASLYSEEIASAPEAHLDTLIIVRNLLRDAQAIYRKNNIINVDDQTLTSLQDSMRSLHPQLVQMALQKLEQVIDRTRLLRTQIENAKTQPVAGLKASKEGMVSFLAKAYNEEIQECCLIDLANIDTLLKSDAKQHRDLRSMIRGFNSQLEEMIADPEHEQRLRDKIDGLKQYYRKKAVEV